LDATGDFLPLIGSSLKLVQAVLVQLKKANENKNALSSLIVNCNTLEGHLTEVCVCYSLKFTTQFAFAFVGQSFILA
jgi:hypothetical protein